MSESPPVKFTINPWHFVQMLFNPSLSDESVEISNLQKPHQFSIPLLKKKNGFSILKSAYLLSKYAGAGARLRELKQLRNGLEMTG